MDKKTLLNTGVSLIFIGVFCIVIGVIVVMVGQSTYIEAEKDATDAQRDIDIDDYCDALDEVVEAHQIEVVGNLFYGFGFVIAFSGIALCFIPESVTPPPQQYYQQPQQPQQPYQPPQMQPYQPPQQPPQ